MLLFLVFAIVLLELVAILNDVLFNEFLLLSGAFLLLFSLAFKLFFVALLLSLQPTMSLIGSYFLLCSKKELDFFMWELGLGFLVSFTDIKLVDLSAAL